MSVHRRAGLVFVLVLAAVSPRTVGGEPARFRYQLRPGASYGATLNLALALQLEAEGLPPEAASMVAAGDDLGQQARVLTRLEVGPAGQDGGMTVRGKVEDLYVKMTMGGATFESSDFEEKLDQIGPLVGRVTPDGRAVEIELEKTDSDLPAPAQDALSRLLQVLPVLPDRDLEVGDTFDAPFHFEMPALPTAGETSLAGTCAYTLAALGERDADFTVRCSMSALTNDAEPRMKMSLTGGSKGSARFDRAEGIFRSLRSELSVEMAMEMKLEKEGSAEDEPAQPRLVKIRASAKGPLEFTMDRVVAPK